MPGLGPGDSGFESRHSDTKVFVHTIHIEFVILFCMEKIISQIPVGEVRDRARTKLQGFVEFIREQGVVGLAIGFILGGAVSKVVASLVADLINPLVGLVLPGNGSLAEATFSIGETVFAWGNLVATVIDFVIIAAVVYFGFKMLGLDKLDKKK